MRHGRAAMTEEIREVCGPREAEQFGGFCDWLRRLYDLEMPSFIERNYDSPLDLARPIRPALELVRLGGFGKLHKVVARHFDDDRLRRLFSFQAMYAGLAPYEALAIYAVITYMDTVNGVFVPVGGMHALPTAIADAAAGAGATFRYGTRVERILLANGSTGAVRGVRLVDGEVVPADVVVANPDLPVVYRSLAPGTAAAPVRASRARTRRPPSCGTSASAASCPLASAHHNIHFGQQWDGVLPGDLRRRCPHARPVAAGQRALVARADDGATGRARALRARTGTQPRRSDRLDERARARARAIWRSASASSATRSTSRSSRWSTRSTGKRRVWSGAPRSRSPTGSSRRGPFRPSNVDRRAPGLVFCGSGTVPGVGMPMVLDLGHARRPSALRSPRRDDDAGARATPAARS